MISLEIKAAKPNYDFEAPDLESDTTPSGVLPRIDTTAFLPDNLALMIRFAHLYSPLFVVRPLIDDERELFCSYRQLLVKRNQNWERMTTLRLTPDGKHLGPYSSDDKTQRTVRQLQEIEEALEVQKKLLIQQLCNTYWLRQLDVTPVLLRNAKEPYELERFVLYNGDVWSSLHRFQDCDWAAVITRQAGLDFDAPIGIESFLRLCANETCSSTGSRREAIPEQVRREVWRRDQGRCARCGCRERLEFDHIVPVSKGGGNTARNVELLCESCNRRKGSSVA